MSNAVIGFEWDDGNIAKCQKHGLTQSDIESVFAGVVVILPDPSTTEIRQRAIGRTARAVSCFWYTVRRQLIRPISARYMHAKESAAFEKAYPQLQK
ncbi:MAG TPA: BrnT family toxin [Acetobacteraceae bacterium]